MGVELLAIHWVYLVFILLIIGVMVFRRDTTLVSILGIFTIALMAAGSVTTAVSSVFNSFIYAITELLTTILVICIIVAMSHVLTASGVNELMIRPVARLIRSPGWAYWIIGLVMMVVSWFFWPSPGVALIGAVLLPVALRVGLPALGVAMAMNLFGHGIALSSDFVIQGAPSITSKAAGIPVADVIAASVPLVFVMGAVTTLIAYWMLRRDMKSGALTVDQTQLAELLAESPQTQPSLRVKWIASLVPLLFLIDIASMLALDLKGGDATALLGGTATFILIVTAISHHQEQRMEKITEYLIQGFQFGFKVFGPVIPIAAFFYLGDSGFAKIIGDVLPSGSNGIVNDLGVALANAVPLNPAIGAVTLTTVGAITGLDGSGFSGVSLAGSIAKLFGAAVHSSIATLTALGQIAAIWVGGGTLVPWALIPAAAIAGVDPFELARRNLIPVVIGLIATTIVAMFIA